MKRVLVAALFLLALLAAPCVGRAEEWEPGAAPASGPQPLTLGMVLYSDAAAQEEAIAPLAAYLGKRLGREVRVSLYRDYFGILNGLDHESVDIAILAPAIYALIMDEPAISLIGIPLERDKLFYHSVILAAKDGPITRVSSLEGRKIGFVDRYSTSGYLVPAAWLAEQGLLASGSRRYEPVFLGSHAKAVRALLENKVDAVCTYDTFFDFTNHQIGEYKNLDLGSFRLLKMLPERIPADALVCRAALGKEVAGTLEKALLDYRTLRGEKDSPLQKVIYTGFQTRPGNGYRDLRARLDAAMGTKSTKEADHQ